MSIIFNGRENQILNVIRTFTEPFLKPGRMIQEKISPDSPIDFSPMIALLILYFIEKIVMTILR